MSLFRRRKPLHERLAAAGDLELDPDAVRRQPSLAAEAPGWHGEPRGEPGIHGVPRVRRWDAVAAADAPGLRGEAVHFVALADGTLLVEEDEPDDALSPLADAVEQTLAPPYRAEGVRRAGGAWAVGASRIQLATVPELTGDEAELVVTREARTLNVDGRPTFGSAPSLDRLGQATGAEYVVRASRLEGNVWQVEVSPL